MSVADEEGWLDSRVGRGTIEVKKGWFQGRAVAGRYEGPKGIETCRDHCRPMMSRSRDDAGIRFLGLDRRLAYIQKPKPLGTHFQTRNGLLGRMK